MAFRSKLGIIAILLWILHAAMCLHTACQDLHGFTTSLIRATIMVVRASVQTIEDRRTGVFVLPKVFFQILS